MRRFLVAVAVTAAVLLFLAANRGAYEGYFSADDLDTLSWAKSVSPGEFVREFLKPFYSTSHFRPVGHLAYHVLVRVAGFDYRAYVAFLHAVHMVNALLVLILLRRFQISWQGAVFGAFFFLFPVAVADAFWKPMYVFDVLCALGVLLALLTYVSGRTVLALAFFWLACKSKEHAAMLALVLAGYEYAFGGRRWRKLIPFGVIAAAFVTSALMQRQPPDSSYATRFSIPVLVRTTSFYVSRMLLYPYLGVAALALPRFVNDRRVWFGLAGFAFLLGPLLTVPGRLSPAYLYVPLIFLSLALATAASRLSHAAAAIVLLIWIPLNYAHLRKYRRTELTLAADRREYKAVVDHLPRDWPDTKQFVYDGRPEDFAAWGILGALRIAYSREVELISMEQREQLPDDFWTRSVVVLGWNPALRKLTAFGRRENQPDETYVTVSQTMPVWQLGRGWYPVEGKFRWTKPEAEARVRRPEGTTRFEVSVLAGPDYIKRVQRARIRVFADGVEVGSGEHSAAGWHVYRFSAPGPAGTVRLRFVTEPPLQPNPWDSPLGSAVGGFGFR